MSLSPAFDTDDASDHLLRFWQIVVNALEKKIPLNQFRTWLEPLSCSYAQQVFQSPIARQNTQNADAAQNKSDSENHAPIQNKKYINIYAPNSFKINYAKRNFLNDFDQAAQTVWPEAYIHFQFLVADKELLNYQQNNLLVQTNQVSSHSRKSEINPYDKPHPGKAQAAKRDALQNAHDPHSNKTGHSDDEVFSAFGLTRIEAQASRKAMPSSIQSIQSTPSNANHDAYNHYEDRNDSYYHANNNNNNTSKFPSNTNNNTNINTNKTSQNNPQSLRNTAPNHEIYETAKLNPALNFENFVQGQANTLARSAAVQIARDFQRQHPVCVFYGAVGLGKTHLIQAIGNHVAQNYSHAKIRYIHAEQFVSDVVKSYQKKAFSDLKKNYHSLNVLLIDDIQFLAGKQKTQEEFFHMFEHLMNRKALLILTADTYPKNLKDIDSRLVSRFLSGLNIAIHPPELEMRIAILKNKAHAENFNLPDDVAFFIANQLKSNVRELEGALRKFMVFHQFQPDLSPSLHSARLALMDIIPGLENMVFDLPVQNIDAPKKRKPRVSRKKKVDVLVDADVSEVSEVSKVFEEVPKKVTLDHKLLDAAEARSEILKGSKNQEIQEIQKNQKIEDAQEVVEDFNLQLDFGDFFNTEANSNLNSNIADESQPQKNIKMIEVVEDSNYIQKNTNQNIIQNKVNAKTAIAFKAEVNVEAQSSEKTQKIIKKSTKVNKNNKVDEDHIIANNAESIAQTLSLKQGTPALKINHELAVAPAIFGLADIQTDIKEQQNQSYYYISQIQQLVAKFYQITVEDLLSKKRQAQIALARQVAIFFAKKLTDCSLNEIAKMFGGRDHTTIMHSIKKIQGLYAEDAALKQQIDCLLPSIKSYLNIYY